MYLGNFHSRNFSCNVHPGKYVFFTLCCAVLWSDTSQHDTSPVLPSTLGQSWYKFNHMLHSCFTCRHWDCPSAGEAIHYNDVIMSAIASQITSLTIVYSTVYSDADQRQHQSSASLAFVWGIHRGPVNFPHKWPVTRKMFPFDDVIMPKE